MFDIEVDLLKPEWVLQLGEGSACLGTATAVPPAAYTHPLADPSLTARAPCWVAPTAPLLPKGSSVVASTWKSPTCKAQHWAVTWITARCDIVDRAEMRAAACIAAPPHRATPRSPLLSHKVKTTLQKTSAFTTPCWSLLLPLIFSNFCYLGFIWTSPHYKILLEGIDTTRQRKLNWYAFEKATCTCRKIDYKLQSWVEVIEEVTELQLNFPIQLLSLAIQGECMCHISFGFDLYLLL